MGGSRSRDPVELFLSCVLGQSDKADVNPRHKQPGRLAFGEQDRNRLVSSRCDLLHFHREIAARAGELLTGFQMVRTESNEGNKGGIFVSFVCF
jgi:hypothetical protein